MKIYKIIFSSLILFSCISNAHAQWELLNSGSNKNLSAIEFFNPLRGIAVGDSGTILKTNNGGNSWTQVSISVKKYLRDVVYQNTNTLYIAGDAGNILKSNNGGTSWTIQTSNSTAPLSSIDFLNDTLGIAVGGNGTILRTHDAGITWTKISSPTIFILNKVRFGDKNYVYAVGSNGTILRSKNTGLNWDIISNSSSASLNGLEIIHDSCVYISGGNGLVLKSTDRLNHMVALPQITNNWLKNIHCFNEGKCLAAGITGTLIKAWGDMDWSTNLQGVYEDVEDAFIINKDTAFLCGKQGLLMRTYDGGIGIQEHHVADEISAEISPNPLQHQTTLRLHLEKEQDILIDICTSQGQKIESLIHAKMSQGDHQIPIAINQMPGLFFIRIQSKTKNYTLKAIKIAE